MILELIRDDDPLLNHNFGKLFHEGKYFGETLEDKDRYLEAGGEKIAKETAIPRGRYKVELTPSTRWHGKIMPQILDVPGFLGVRFHGGNTEADTEGCVLLGNVRTASGVANCAGINARLINLIAAATDKGEETWLEVK